MAFRISGASRSAPVQQVSGRSSHNKSIQPRVVRTTKISHQADGGGLLMRLHLGRPALKAAMGGASTVDHSQNTVTRHALCTVKGADPGSVRPWREASNMHANGPSNRLKLQPQPYKKRLPDIRGQPFSHNRKRCISGRFGRHGWDQAGPLHQRTPRCTGTPFKRRIVPSDKCSVTHRGISSHDMKSELVLIQRYLGGGCALQDKDADSSSSLRNVRQSYL
jgi:hypothetical protein